eukprot:5001144-Alexandrium_andersonii.AAC.1
MAERQELARVRAALRPPQRSSTRAAEVAEREPMRRGRRKGRESKRQGLPGGSILAPAVWSELWNFFVAWRS